MFYVSLAATAPAKVVLAATDCHAFVLQSFANARINHAYPLRFSGHWNDRHDLQQSPEQFRI
jgi:hypothetical protein